MSENRNIANFYKQIQSQSGLRFNYQFVVRLAFKERLYVDRGINTSYDNVIWKQLGITDPSTINDLLLGSDTMDPTRNITFFAQGTSIPQTTINTTTVSYFAQSFAFPAIINYPAQWSLSILLDQRLTIYRQLMAWQELISSIARNNGGNKTIPEVRGEVELLDSFGTSVQRRFSIQGIFPKNLPQISMQYTDGGGQPIKLDGVTFAMQYFRQVDPRADHISLDPFKEYEG